MCPWCKPLVCGSHSLWLKEQLKSSHFKMLKKTVTSICNNRKWVGLILNWPLDTLTSAVEHLSYVRSGQYLIASETVCQMTSDGYDNGHQEMRKRGQHSTLRGQWGQRAGMSEGQKVRRYNIFRWSIRITKINWVIGARWSLIPFYGIT